MKNISRSATTGQNGRWFLKMSALSTSTKGMEVEIASGEETIALEDVMVDEVWLCSKTAKGVCGQSSIYPIILPLYQEAKDDMGAVVSRGRSR